MNNLDNQPIASRGRKKLFRRADGRVGLITDPLGNCIGVDDVEDVVELELTDTEWSTLRERSRKDNLDFAALKRKHGKKPKDTGVQPGGARPTDTMKE
jgi:hypothetical protein